MLNPYSGQQYRIIAVRKQPRYDPYLAISHVQFAGNALSVFSGRTIVTLEEAIAMIEGGASMVTGVAPGAGFGSVLYPPKILIGMSPQGNKYLRTDKDGLAGNNLLSLPEC